MNILHQTKRIFFATLLSSLPLAFASAPSFSAPPAHSSAFTALQSKAERQGTIRVIATLSTPWMVEAMLPDQAAVQGQRARIAAQQRAVTAKIAHGNAKVRARFQFIPGMTLEVDADDLERLANLPEISAIQEDELAAPSLDSSRLVIGAEDAWALGYTGAGWTVAVLDTGVDKSHPFLTGKVVSEACYSTTDAAYGSTSVCPNGVATTTATDSGVNCDTAVIGCEHGTHVAGIAAARDPDGTLNGTAPDANLIAIQVFSRFDNATYCGSVDPCALTWTSDQILALERVYALRSTYNIAAVNMSLGGGQYNVYCDTDSRKTIIDNLLGAGIATAIASGNNYWDGYVSAPGCISSAITVGATDDFDAVASFSNHATLVDLMAPGVSITSAVPGGGTATWNGTSMATPHVAGAWAVLREAYPTADVATVLNSFINTGTPVTRASITKPRINVDLASVYNNLILNGDGNDNTLNGGDYNDTIDGGAGNDTIDGGAGADTITGGIGRDTLTGGTGADILVYNSRDDRGDIITDFDPAEDHFDVNGLLTAEGITPTSGPIADGHLGAISSRGQTYLIFYPAGGRAVTLALLQGVLPSQINDDALFYW